MDDGYGYLFEIDGIYKEKETCKRKAIFIRNFKIRARNTS